ncbi:metallophosphoesterase family protein [Sphingomonas psychrotolerans]|uniref:YfcE family phosphodiesterase n=1 Tax=Sphingomonas psychrotolerans TaxID=1327635 RepID=A0A2K8MCY8_9SPHN|nr:metallophosphoesterase family protein [Sphingomonas psychrotolerans]ATY31752.1 YfcE family phosphodiesterase [Sphingomonas psychrotolerans]
MSRIAVLSDIHGNLPALEAVVADAAARGCKRFLNLGDILSGPLWPIETADFLMARDWPTIAGNHERQLLHLAPERMNASDAFTRSLLSDAQLRWMAGLPATLALDDLFLCHGTPASDVEHFLETIEPTGLRRATEAEVRARLGDRPESLTLCGHSHMPDVQRLADGRSVANPGSVGLQAFHDDQPWPYSVAAGDPDARYAILDGTEPTFHTVPYDHVAAVAKAEREGRHDWAKGLATGRP